jgi:hypothetical protein
VHSLKGEHLVGVPHLLPLHAPVVVSQLVFQKLEAVPLADERVRSQRHVQKEGRGLHLIHQILVVLSGFFNDLRLRWWHVHLILFNKVALCIHNKTRPKQ